MGFAILQGGPLVESAGLDYWRGRAWGAPAAYAVFALTGWLIGVGRTRAVLVVNLVFSVTNIGLDLWFVLGLDLGVAGVAWATAAADVTAAAVGVFYSARIIRAEGGLRPEALDWDRLTNPASLRRLVAVNTDMMVGDRR